MYLLSNASRYNGNYTILRNLLNCVYIWERHAYDRTLWIIRVCRDTTIRCSGSYTVTRFCRVFVSFFVDIMKSVLALIALIMVAEGHTWGQQYAYGPRRDLPFQGNPGHGFGRHNNPFYNHQWYQQPQMQSNNFIDASFSNADWVCRNPKTGDMMIIASETPTQGTSNGPQWSPQYPSSDYYPQHQTTQYYPQNQNTEQRPVDTNDNNENRQTTAPPKNIVTESMTPPSSHGGEGLIDIRMGNK